MPVLGSARQGPERTELTMCRGRVTQRSVDMYPERDTPAHSARQCSPVLWYLLARRDFKPGSVPGPDTFRQPNRAGPSDTPLRFYGRLPESRGPSVACHTME